MRIYTAHDAVIILKRNTLLKYLKDYSFDLKIYTDIEDAYHKKFIVLIDENKWFMKFAFKVNPKLEKAEFADYDEIVSYINKYKLQEHIINIRTNYIPD